ncbi:MAG: sel1 repeat family protein [Pseudobutyrivibrio sp.]|nr:sel1 repeat family protein [Pseudobutyrivibrio sp.]
MKRNIQFFLMTLMATTVLVGCSTPDTSADKETPDTTEQVVVDEVKDYSVLSYNELEVLANEGDVEAQYMLGRLLEYGSDDVKQDFEEALEWYQEAADAGSADATNAIAYFYLTGTYYDQDLDKAAELFNSAIENGSVNANVGLARTLLAGLTDEELEAIATPPVVEDVTEDSETDSATDTADPTESDTADTSEKSDAAETVEDEDSTKNTKEETTEEETTDSDKTEVEADDELTETANTIYELIKKAYTEGDIDGKYYLGYLYEKGIGVPGDYSEAYSYYSRVAADTSEDIADQFAINSANTAIGLFYMNGYGVEANTETAITYFTAAADNGYAKASYYLGQIYENGLDVDRDYEQAMEYYLQAADSDFAPALNQIGYMYYNGYGVDVDFASAVYYQKLAALQGYAPAQVNLGFLYENGYGVERNLETALSYYEMAADSNYEGAMEAVVRVRAQINEETEE